MVDGRYHVATLAAIFLSLGLGILIGLTLGSDAENLQEQGVLIRSIEEHLSSLRAANTQLETDLVNLWQVIQYQEEAMQSAAVLIAQGLNGKKVGILTDSEFLSVAQDLREFLTSLGMKTGIMVWNSHSPTPSGQENIDWDLIGMAVANALMGQEFISPIESLISSGRVEFDGELWEKEALIIIGLDKMPFNSSLIAQVSGSGTKGIIAQMDEEVGNYTNIGWQVVRRIESMAGRLGIAMALL